MSCNKMISKLSVNIVKPRLKQTNTRNNPRHAAQRRLAIVHANKHDIQMPPSYLEFAERVNGRAAMQGFVWGSVNEAITDNNVYHQLISKNPDGTYAIMSGDVLNLIFVVAAVALGTAVTTFVPNQELEESSARIAPQFTSDAELLNGRLAMIGFAMLLFFT